MSRENMINYSHLYSWRNLCEFLNSRPYKFAQPSEIKTDCKCLPSLYGINRVHRNYLFKTYLIQFIHWCISPDHMYSCDRRSRKKEIWGWQLCRDWEYKINYLESIVLFGYEPPEKVWAPALRERMRIREERIKTMELRNRFKRLSPDAKQQACKELNICPRCFHPIPTLMIDCVNCGFKIQD